MRIGITVAGVSLALIACQAQGPELSETSSNLVNSPTPTVTFPTTTVGATSAPITIQLNPLGVQSVNVINSITESCPDFAVQAQLPGYAEKYCEPDPGCGPLPVAGIQEQCRANAVCGPGSYTQAYTFTATFTPTAAVASSCPLTINYTSNGSATTYTVTLNGTGAPPPIAGDSIPATAQFGDVRVGTTSSAANITLRNTGGAAINVTGVTVSPAEFAITAGTTTGFALAAGATRAYTVTCAPGTVGLKTGTFTVTSSNYGNITTQLRCTGVDSALDISPSPTQLPTTRVGEPLDATITLVNSGGAPMAISSVELTGAEMQLMAMPPSGTMLAASGGSATAQVRFMAQAPGEAEATLTVTYDSGQVRTSQITARALATSMSVTPSGTVDLGPVCVGQTLTKSFDVVANADGPFIVEDVGMPAGTFTLTAAGLPASVEGAGATTYNFEVAAAPTVEGTEVGMITLKTDIPGAEDAHIDVSVLGLPAGVSGTPAELYIGATDVGMTTVAQRLQITNCDSTAIEITSAQIVGDEANQFAIVVNPESLTIPPLSSIEWLVIATPDTVGEHRADFIAEYGGGPDNGGGTITISLVGDGLGEIESVDSSETPSYYACSASGATGAWPFALALGAIMLRRRRR